MLVISANEQRNLVNMKEVIAYAALALKEFSAERTITPIRGSLPFASEKNTALIMPSVEQKDRKENDKRDCDAIRLSNGRTARTFRRLVLNDDSNRRLIRSSDKTFSSSYRKNVMYYRDRRTGEGNCGSCICS